MSETDTLAAIGMGVVMSLGAICIAMFVLDHGLEWIAALLVCSFSFLTLVGVLIWSHF